MVEAAIIETAPKWEYIEWGRSQNAVPAAIFYSSEALGPTGDRIDGAIGYLCRAETLMWFLITEVMPKPRETDDPAVVFAEAAISFNDMPMEKTLALLNFSDGVWRVEVPADSGFQRDRAYQHIVIGSTAVDGNAYGLGTALTSEFHAMATLIEARCAD